jgi:hypothetical protein
MRDHRIQRWHSTVSCPGSNKYFAAKIKHAFEWHVLPAGVTVELVQRAGRWRWILGHICSTIVIYVAIENRGKLNVTVESTFTDIVSACMIGESHARRSRVVVRPLPGTRSYSGTGYSQRKAEHTRSTLWGP